MEIILGIFVFILGVCIGSFINCVVYRIEQEKSFLKGRSFCPNCRHSLNWKDLFPVFSYLLLGGKCRYCKKKISIQYPVVEIFTGVIFVLIFNKFIVIPNLIGNPGTLQALWIPAFAGMTANLVFMFYLASALIIIFLYDLKHYLIPDNVLFPAIFIAIIYRFFEGFAFGALQPFLYYLLAVIIASGFFFVIWFVSRGKWMGFGDVKLAILLGLILGFPNILLGLFLAFFFGAIIGVGLMSFNKKNMKSEIPFGPFLITGTFVAMLWGTEIIKWYMGLFLQ